MKSPCFEEKGPSVSLKLHLQGHFPVYVMALFLGKCVCGHFLCQLLLPPPPVYPLEVGWAGVSTLLSGRMGPGTLSATQSCPVGGGAAGAHLTPQFPVVVLVPGPPASICRSVLNRSKKILFPASRGRGASNNTQHFTDVFRGGEEEIKLLLCPKPCSAN